MAKEIIIKGEGLSKTYKTLVDEVKVFEGLDVEIVRGNAVSIMGESGRGKTTLLNILSGLDRPSNGYVHFGGERIDNMDEAALALFRNDNVGFIFQHHYLLRDFTALENALIPVRMAKQTVAESDVSRVKDMLDMVGLKDRMDHYPDQLSGGERQRVAIVRALANEPSVIFADEPTGSLDRKNAANVEGILWELKKRYKMTLVIATHSHDISKKCDVLIDMG